MMILLLQVSKVVAAYIIGGKLQRKLFGNKKSTWLQNALAAMLVWLVFGIMGLVPLGGLIAYFLEMLLVVMGMGFVIMHKYGMLRMAWMGKGKK